MLHLLSADDLIKINIQTRDLQVVEDKVQGTAAGKGQEESLLFHFPEDQVRAFLDGDLFGEALGTGGVDRADHGCRIIRFEIAGHDLFFKGPVRPADRGGEGLVQRDPEAGRLRMPDRLEDSFCIQQKTVHIKDRTFFHPHSSMHRRHWACGIFAESSLIK